MKIKNTKAINEKIMSYVEKREYERFLSAAIVLPVSSENMQFRDVEKLKELASQFLEHAKSDGIEYSSDEAMLAAMILVLVRKYGGNPGNDKEFLYDALARNGRIFHENDLADDPFLKQIWIGGESYGRFTFSNQSCQPYELFFYDSPADIGNGIKIPKLGAFDHIYNYPYLTKDGAGIRGLTPYQIFTLQEPIQKAAGNVLLLGCGMGYYAYMAHRKEAVQKLTIVDNDAELLELFKMHLLPQFDHPEKIEVIHADPFAYMEALEDGKYDLCFADLWVNNMDTVPYLKLKKICRRFRKMKLSCWIEESLTDMLLNMVFVLILEAFNANIGLAAPSPEGVSAEGKQVLDLLRSALDKEEISRPDHIDWYLNADNILKML